uniref:PHD finger protein ALFIN-LIKE n=1 Tax=Aegilops tauschii subsp. strangulata TaxID=200361 RepID=A0A453M8V4_AEGTS
MNRRDWLSLVAVHSDSWLLSVAFFFGAPLTANERKKEKGLILMAGQDTSIFVTSNSERRE